MRCRDRSEPGPMTVPTGESFSRSVSSFVPLAQFSPQYRDLTCIRVETRDYPWTVPPRNCIFPQRKITADSRAHETRGLLTALIIIVSKLNWCTRRIKLLMTVVGPRSIRCDKVDSVIKSASLSYEAVACAIIFSLQSND